MRLNTIGFKHDLLKEAISWGFVSFDASTYKEAALVAQGIELIRQRAFNNNDCNGYFRTLVGFRTFDEIYLNENVWISYAKNEKDFLGYTFTNDKLKKHDIAVTERGFSHAKRGANPAEEVAAIIVHEMAHVGGAPDKGVWADAAKKHCGFSKQYNPYANG